MILPHPPLLNPARVLRYGVQPGDWLDRELTRIGEGLTNGGVKSTCGHLVPPLIAQLWAPTEVSCAHCSHWLLREAGLFRETECDQCRQFAETQLVFWQPSPALVIAGRLCGTCLLEESAR